ncbi:transketolase [Membranicola marinus]|uniref:Transketolase n=1 Tax=Membranihabitans marinus TaxID=1227546 RepID=A0A953LDI6_9BACT|nr:transketolase [Membranihabitans marinus]MBY5958919.1 transketolase [Membranihabitans marinus]
MDKTTNLAIDTIRTLSMDAVQKANSGHPGTPMALAPAAYVLYKNIMNYNPRNPNWINRDRFVLSCGHASMLQYSLLYLTGFDVTLDDLKDFRQWGSKTAGHPEYGHTPGVETTTGPLGQGFANAVGMAMAEKHMAAVFNTDNHEIIDHHTYCICSDGDLMEGISHEAASIAGHLKLGKLICLFDDNNITIEGKASMSCSDDQVARFKAHGWQVIDLGEKGNDIDAIEEAFQEAKSNTDQPSMIILKTTIGYGSPNKQNTPGAHGSPLGDEEIVKTKEYYEFPSAEPFFIPDDVLNHMRTVVEAGVESETKWNDRLAKYQKDHPKLAEKLHTHLNHSFPENWDSEVPVFSPKDGPMATRAVNSSFLNAVADKLTWLVGGSADLEPSTKTLIKNSDYFQSETPQGRNIAWGIRELGMCAASSGIQLHGGLRPYAATFFVFTDYARPAIRLAALMNQPVIYAMTHDSIGLGEDGPTHQPIEHLASLRAMPGLTVIRPADANETTEAWKAALKNQSGPTMLVLTRQKLPILDRDKYAPADMLHKGAYVISPEKGSTPDVVLIGTGSEVHLLIQAQEELHKDNIDARVVSMPSWELFEQQSNEYQEKVLPAGVRKRLAVETGASLGWHRWVGDQGDLITVDHFGASAPYEEIFEHFGFTVENIVKKAKALHNN